MNHEKKPILSSCFRRYQFRRGGCQPRLLRFLFAQMDIHFLPLVHPPMAQEKYSDAQRQAVSRKARGDAGGKQIAVMLTPAAAAKLASHVAKGESITSVVNRLLCESNPH